ncbi:MAG: toll/interleukin-1 receptor domain-containing protein [Planctomycetaceae bacterium]
MAKIFISYRRDDSGYIALMLRDKLEERFGRQSVYLDIDNIPFGIDFRDHIDSAVSQCDVMLAVIGSAWSGANLADGTRRIDSRRMSSASRSSRD